MAVEIFNSSFLILHSPLEYVGPGVVAGYVQRHLLLGDAAQVDGGTPDLTAGESHRFTSRQPSSQAGKPGSQVSGKTTSWAPCAAAWAIKISALASEAGKSRYTEAARTAATIRRIGGKRRGLTYGWLKGERD